LHAPRGVRTRMRRREKVPELTHGEPPTEQLK
jgi:hypothetical protein